MMEHLTGHQFGRYKIIEPIGAGGMASVYKAYQADVDRYVALKLLAPQLSRDPQFVERFTHEARTLAKLQHPHILPLYDFGSTDEQSYLVMPYVSGGDMAGLMRRQRFSLSYIGQLFGQLGDALDYAHDQGIIHRDVKPSNVLMNEQGYCLLSDFGLAKMVAGNQKLTATGFVMGSPEYMSPEQGLGEAVDRRTDVYALGVMLYEIVTGRVPFKADTWSALIVKAIQDPIVPPSVLNPELPSNIEQVILRACAKKPVDRFQRAGEMVTALQEAIMYSPQVMLPPELPVTVEPSYRSKNVPDVDATNVQPDFASSQQRAPSSPPSAVGPPIPSGRQQSSRAASNTPSGAPSSGPRGLTDLRQRIREAPSTTRPRSSARPVAPSPARKRDYTTIGLIGLLVILLVALVGIGFLWWGSGQVDGDVQLNEATPVEQPVVEPLPTLLPTTDLSQPAAGQPTTAVEPAAVSEPTDESSIVTNTPLPEIPPATATARPTQPPPPATPPPPPEGGGNPPAPPLEAVTACEGQVGGDSCSFNGPRGRSITGSCQMVIDQLACFPADGSPPP